MGNKTALSSNEGQIDADNTVCAEKPVKKKRKFRREWLWCWIVVSIPIVGYIFFNAFPVAISLASMFTNIQHNQISTMKWNNFAHFVKFFHDAKYLKALGITLWLTSAQFVSLFIALVIATLSKTKVKGSRLLQTLYFVPYICSVVAVTIMWNQMFLTGDDGVLNTILGTNINWRGDPKYLTWCIFTVIVWQSPGYGIVMITTAFVGVDPTLYEAAKIDGANAWKQYFHITLPQIAPMILFLALAGWQGGLATFDAAQVMAPVGFGGTAGPEDMGLTLAYYNYIQGMLFSHMDYASVMNWMTAIINFAGAYLFLRLRKRAEDNLG